MWMPYGGRRQDLITKAPYALLEDSGGEGGADFIVAQDFQCSERSSYVVIGGIYACIRCSGRYLEGRIEGLDRTQTRKTNFLLHLVGPKFRFTQTHLDTCVRSGLGWSWSQL